MSFPTAAQPDSRGVLVAVRDALPALHPAERKIADDLLADPERFARRSISETAAQAGTSTATVVRFYQRIGYPRFKDLRHDLAQESYRERLATEDSPADASDIARDDTLAQVIAKVARDETHSIGDTAELLDTAVLADAVQLIAGAQRTDIFGVGASSIAGVDLQRKLSRIGRTAIDWAESHVAWTSASVLGSDAVAVAISHSGSTVDTIEFLRLARASGASTIAITNFAQSPLTAEADVVLRTAARETAFRSGALGSRIAQLMIVDCLFVGVVQTSYDSSMAAIRTTYDAVRPRSARAPWQTTVASGA